MNAFSTVRWLLAVLLLNMSWSTVSAHETPVALLTLTERDAGQFAIDWTYSSSINQNPPRPIFPEHCQTQGLMLDCGSRGLYGELSMEQLGERYSAAVVQIARLDEEKTQSFTLTGASPSVNLVQGGHLPLSQVFMSYVPLGVEHILLGIDHLAFVLGLMWLVTGSWMLVRTITAFTVAHSITLAAVTLGYIGAPVRPIEAAIALSIVFLAVEVHQRRQGLEGFSTRYPWVIAFGFGLLHGFGFAGALSAIGLPPENLPSALLFFNVGVEIGQLLFVGVVLLLIQLFKVMPLRLPQHSHSFGVYALGGLASYWFISRLASMVVEI